MGWYLRLFSRARFGPRVYGFINAAGSEPIGDFGGAPIRRRSFAAGKPGR
jgi:hypothetical protein